MATVKEKNDAKDLFIKDVLNLYGEKAFQDGKEIRVNITPTIQLKISLTVGKTVLSNNPTSQYTKETLSEDISEEDKDQLEKALKELGVSF